MIADMIALIYSSDLTTESSHLLVMKTHDRGTGKLKYPLFENAGNRFYENDKLV